MGSQLILFEHIALLKQFYFIIFHILLIVDNPEKLKEE